MSNELDELRETIRKILEQQNSAMDNSKLKESSNNTVFSWAHFEEFGIQLLEALKYKGNYDIIYKIKEQVERQGWHFDT